MSDEKKKEEKLIQLDVTEGGTDMGLKTEKTGCIAGSNIELIDIELGVKKNKRKDKKKRRKGKTQTADSKGKYTASGIHPEKDEKSSFIGVDKEKYTEGLNPDDFAKHPRKVPDPDKVMEDIKYAQENPHKNKFPEYTESSFLMSFPFYISSDIPNNIWMENYENGKGKLDVEVAWAQWWSLYSVLCNFGVVYLLPAREGYQDLVFTTNLGAVLPHHIAPCTIILSNFRTSPRVGEDNIGRNFFNMMGFNVLQSPYFFEGAAELKYLRDNIFFGGYGIRSDVQTYQWLEDMFDVEIIPIKMTDPYLYHLDTMLFPLDRENIILSECVSEADLVRIEKYANVHMVTKDQSYNGICNCVRIENVILNGSDIEAIDRTFPGFYEEADRIDRLEEICSDLLLELCLIDLGELWKSGAALSCMVMNMNYKYFSPRKGE